MDNIIKIRAAQGTFDTSGNTNNCDFYINENSGVINLSESHISINVRVNQDSAAAIPNKIAALTQSNSGIYDSHIRLRDKADASRDNFVSQETGCWVRHAELLCKKGKVESIRDNDVLRVNRSVYLKDLEQQRKGIQGYTAALDGCGDAAGAMSMNEIVKVGSVPSRVRDFDIKIPLKSIYNIADAKDGMGNSINWDTSAGAYGRTQMHLQLNLERMIATQGFFNSDTRANFQKTVGSTGSAYEAMQDQTYDAANSNVAGQMRFLITAGTYDAIEQSPFYNGMKLAVTAAGGTGPAINPVVGIVSSIEHTTTKHLKLNLGNDLVTTGTAGQTHTGLRVVGVPADTSSVTVNSLELVAKVVQEDAPAEEIEYTTFVTENDTFPTAQTRVNRNYLIESNCRNVYMAFADVIYSTEPLSDYRISLDNKDVTNRVVQLHSPLHRDLIGQTFKNEGKIVKSMREKLQQDLSSGVNATDQGSRVYLIAVPVPLLDRPQRLGVELNFTGAHAGSFTLFKEIVKLI